MLGFLRLLSSHVLWRHARDLRSLTAAFAFSRPCIVNVLTCQHEQSWKETAELRMRHVSIDWAADIIHSTTAATDPHLSSCYFFTTRALRSLPPWLS